jgi:hypothetical protein
MMPTEIRKYKLDNENDDIQEIEIPILGRIVNVGEYPNGAWYIWAEVEITDEPNPEDPDTPKRRFQLIATGAPLPPRGKTVGTIISTRMGLVRHVVELPTKWSETINEASQDYEGFCKEVLSRRVWESWAELEYVGRMERLQLCW